MSSDSLGVVRTLPRKTKIAKELFRPQSFQQAPDKSLTVDNENMYNTKDEMKQPLPLGSP